MHIGKTPIKRLNVLFKQYILEKKGGTFTEESFLDNKDYVLCQIPSCECETERDLLISQSETEQPLPLTKILTEAALQLTGKSE